MLPPYPNSKNYPIHHDKFDWEEELLLNPQEYISIKFTMLCLTSFILYLYFFSIFQIFRVPRLNVGNNHKR